jgi:hypothetical protein
MRFAEYLQALSAGHDKQLVAAPASAGLRFRLKCWSEPVLATVDGRWGGGQSRAEQSAGEHSNHSSTSMSWQLLVNKLGAEVLSRRLPHNLSAILLIFFFLDP